MASGAKISSLAPGWLDFWDIFEAKENSLCVQYLGHHSKTTCQKLAKSMRYCVSPKFEFPLLKCYLVGCYRIGMSRFPNLNCDRHSDSVISFRLKVQQSSYEKEAFFHSKRSDNTKNSSSSMKLDVRLKKIRSCIVLKDAIAKKVC